MAEETKRVGLLVRSTYIEHIYLYLKTSMNLKTTKVLLALVLFGKLKSKKLATPDIQVFTTLFLKKSAGSNFKCHGWR